MRDSNSRLLSALGAVFTPLASLLIRQGVAAGPAVEELKIAFVEAARKEHGRAGKPASINRISHLTGFGRKHVSDLLKKSSQAVPRPDKIVTSEAEILSKWWTSPDYLDEAGLPIDLDMGPGPRTFVDLVRKTLDSDSALTYLKNLEARGSVEILENGLVRVKTRRHLLTNDLPRIISSSLASLAGTISRNWGGPEGEGFRQRTAHAASVRSDRVSALRRISRERIDNLLEDIDDLMSSFESEDEEPTVNPEGCELLEVGVGAFYFEIEK